MKIGNMRAAVLGAVLVAVMASVTVQPAALAVPASKDKGWTVSWATSQHTTGAPLRDQSVRMIVHLTQGGDSVRIRIGNRLGTEPLRLGAATVGVRDTGAALVADTVRPLTFGGARSASVAAGGYLVSDPVRLDTTPQQDLGVSIHVPGTATPSAHGSAYDTSFLAPADSGDRTADAGGSAYTSTTTSYLMVEAVDVHNPDVPGAVVVTGGSVTDGAGSRTTGTFGSGPAAPPNSRWSDVLARRYVQERPVGQQLAVVNAGIGGNSASRECFGGASPYGSVQNRLDRDVFSLTNVKYLIVYAGTNDLGFGTGCSAPEIIAAFQDIIDRAHAHGIRVIMATVTPRAIYTPEQNEARLEVNRWITKLNSCGGECDGVADFNAAISWYVNPNAIDPRYDSGDDIHPNADGYKLMGETIQLAG